jgi:hypothetical protein
MTQKNVTAAQIEIPPRIVAVPIEPETIRLPKPGQLCPYFGLSRSALNQLILPCQLNGFKPPVKSFCLRQRGARTGIRLIDFASLKAYILAHEECAQGEGVDAN